MQKTTQIKNYQANLQAQQNQPTKTVLSTQKSIRHYYQNIKQLLNLYTCVEIF